MAYLKFYYGVMGAGKTTELIKTYEIYKHKNFRPIVIKPSIDTREGNQIGWGTTSSRLIKESIPAYYFKDLQTEIKNLNYNIILVDEAQFLTKQDVKVLSDIVDSKNIDVIAYGLKTDINNNLFTGAKELLINADITQELESLCEIPNCRHKAIMHLRYINNKIDKSKNQIAIEKDNIIYKAVCRKHWHQLLSEKYY